MTEWLATPVLIALSMVGHLGLVIAFYNRINALGWKRRVIKLYEKSCFLLGLLIPMALIVSEWNFLGSKDPLVFSSWLLSTKCYVAATALFALISVPVWIANRPTFVLAFDRENLISSNLQSPNDFTESPFRGRLFATMARLPGNQIGFTELNCKSIIFDELPDELVGLKIAHLSDIHFTGQLSNAYYARAIDWLNRQEPDLVVLAGDIVDYSSEVRIIEPVFRSLQARYGKYFLLGNHDRRIKNPMEVCEAFHRIGWHDSGSTTALISIGETMIRILGNEQPWFDRGESQPHEADIAWTLGISHSPDQFLWAQENGCRLLLCGHTHGGQIRFPWIGPLVAPSWHGSRYASGTFYSAGTLMHVSRGLAGVHPFRWGCPPEVTLLKLDRRAYSST